jgi:hypothetical protein
MSAIAKYDDKTLIVSGEVAGTGDSMHGIYIQLSCGKEFIPSIQCFFNKTYASDLSKLKKGQFVSIKGICKSRTLRIVMFESCSIVTI